MQGSIHFWLTQLLDESHSELTIHSGLQLGGVPKNPETHVHETSPLLLLHTELLPHGLGVHGFLGVGSARNIKNKLYIKNCSE